MYSEYIMKNVRQYLGYDATDTSHDEEINEMNADSIFEKFLTWEGIIGYSKLLKKVVLELFPPKDAFAVNPVTKEYYNQSDEAFTYRVQMRTQAILQAALKLHIPIEKLEKDNYIGTLDEDAFVDMENAEKYLAERYSVERN